MPADWNDHTPVPAEFLGLARAFWQRIETATRQADRIRAVSAKKVHRWYSTRPGKGFRPEHFVELINLWRTFPECGALLPLQITRGPKSLSLRLVRLMAGRTTARGWEVGASELGVLAVQYGVDVLTEGTHHNVGPLVTISHHAIGRRYQRGFGASDDKTICGDVIPLLGFFMKAGISASRIEEQFSIDVPSTGRWLGQIGGYTAAERGFVILNVRTFI